MKLSDMLNEMSCNMDSDAVNAYVHTAETMPWIPVCIGPVTIGSIPYYPEYRFVITVKKSHGLFRRREYCLSGIIQSVSEDGKRRAVSADRPGDAEMIVSSLNRISHRQYLDFYRQMAVITEKTVLGSIPCNSCQSGAIHQESGVLQPASCAQ